MLRMKRWKLLQRGGEGAPDEEVEAAPDKLCSR